MACSAVVMASDLASQPDTGLVVQLCGDAHLANFGIFASPERQLVFDLNDFDETHPGPFEWDLARLGASFEIAARSNGFDERARSRVQRYLARTYCRAMAEFAKAGFLEVWYSHLTMADIEARWGDQLSPAAMERLHQLMRKARSKNNLRAFNKLVAEVDGEPRFVSDPPLLERAEEVLSAFDHQDVTRLVRHSLGSYAKSLQPDRRLVLHRYRFADLARKVVGVGSVGTRCWVALLVGRDGGDPLLLQGKEAEASVLEPALGASRWPTHGQRVVEGQRLIQSASDIFLGWHQVRGGDGRLHDYYFRQLWDGKGSANIDAMEPEMMVVYAEACGHTLARAHARTGDPVALSGYLGGGKAMAAALERFSSAYADQNERDHVAFVTSVGTQ